MCPLDVATDFGKCLLMLLTGRPDQLMKYPFFTAVVHVDVTGLPAAACKNCICSLKAVVFCIVFA